MKARRMPPQIVRLVLLTIAIVGSYLVARYFLTPPSFGQYGLVSRRSGTGGTGAAAPVFARGQEGVR